MKNDLFSKTNNQGSSDVDSLELNLSIEGIDSESLKNERLVSVIERIKSENAPTLANHNSHHSHSSFSRHGTGLW